MMKNRGRVEDVLKQAIELSGTDPNAALELLCEAPSTPDLVPIFHGVRGDLLLRLQRTADGLSEHSTAVRFAPGSLGARMARGRALMELQRYTDAKEDFIVAVRARPDYANAHLALALSLAMLEEVDAANRAWQTALSLDPSNAAIPISIAAAFEHASLPLAALAAWTQAARLDPNSSYVLNRRALCIAEVGDREAAYRELAAMIESGKADAETYLILGKTFLSAEEAAGAFERCLQLDPELHDARVLLVEELFDISPELGLECADRQLNELAALEEQTPGLARSGATRADEGIAGEPVVAAASLIRRVRADSLLFLNRVDEAIVAFGSIVELEPENGSAHINLGGLLAKDMPEQAVPILQRGLQLLPGDGIAHAALGRALFESGDIGGALAHGEASVRADGNDAHSRVNFGRALAAAGRNREAFLQYKTALEINPELALAFNNLAVLGQDVLRESGEPVPELAWVTLETIRAWQLRAFALGMVPSGAYELIRSGDAPLSAWKMAGQAPVGEHRGWYAAYLELLEACRIPSEVIDFLMSNAKFPLHERTLYAATVLVHWGNPFDALKLLDQAEDGSEYCNSPAFQFYLTLAASRALDPQAEPIWIFARSKAEQMLSRPSATADDLYYSALLTIEGRPIRPLGPTPPPDRAELEFAAATLHRCTLEFPDHQHAFILYAHCLFLLNRQLEFLYAAGVALRLEALGGLLGQATIVDMTDAWHSSERGVWYLAHHVELSRARHTILENYDSAKSAAGILSSSLEVPSWCSAHPTVAIRLAGSWHARIRGLGQRRRDELIGKLRAAAPYDTHQLDLAWKLQRAAGRSSIHTWIGREHTRGALEGSFAVCCEYAVLSGYIAADQMVLLRVYGRWLRAKNAAGIRAASNSVRRASAKELGVTALEVTPGLAAISASAKALSALVEFFSAEQDADLQPAENETTYVAFCKAFHAWLSRERESLGAPRFDEAFGLNQLRDALIEADTEAQL